MGKINLEIKLNTEDKQNIFICQYYWNITDDMKYKYFVKEIAIKFDIPLLKVTEIVSKNSLLIIKCKSCSNIINKFKKRSDFHSDDFLKDEFFICKGCKTENNKRKEEYFTQQKEFQNSKLKKKYFIDKETKIKRMNVSFNNKVLNELSEMELETLILIAESTTKSEILNKIFYDNNLIKSDFREKVWSRINKIESLDLIWVERDVNLKIIHFHILDELKITLKTQFPELFY